MLPEYNEELKTLTVDNQIFNVSSRKRVRGREYFKLADGRNIISNGGIFLFTPISSYGVRQLGLYESRPPVPDRFLPLTPDTLIYTVEDGVEIYDAVTGACEGGVKAFLAMFTCPPLPATLSKLVEITAGKYGSDILQEAICPTGKRLFFGSQNANGSIIWTPRPKRLSEQELITAEIESIVGGLT